MALVKTPLFLSSTPNETMKFGVEFDDVTLQINRFGFWLDVGNRNARFTIWRDSDGATQQHDFIPGINYVAGSTIWWNPPFVALMKLRASDSKPIPDGWSFALTTLD